MSANSNQHKRSNRKRQRRHQDKGTAMKYMNKGDTDSDNRSLRMHCIQLSESFRD